MKSIIFACSLLLMAFVYGAWRDNGSSAATRAEKDLRLEIIENVFGGGTAGASGSSASAAHKAGSPYGNGQVIPRSEYQPCLDSFVVVMNQYGIQAGAPQPIKNFPSMTYPITTAESLQGSGLLTWMQEVVAKYDPDGKGANLDFQLRFGICTATFVKDMAQDASLTGRITTFIVPAYRLTEAAKKAKAKAAMTTNGDPGQGGYELGGLEP
jgi:hypothetical protein